MTSADRKRQPAGIRTGGQFAHDAKAETGVTLTPSPKQWRADTVEQAMGELDKHGTSTQRPRVMPKESLAALRADLKTLFRHKMSVRMSTGTGFGWGSVSWDDGPLEREVRTVADGYCNERFNGMTDSYDRVNEDSPVEYTLSGVNTHRSIGNVGQAHIDAIFDQAGLADYRRIEPGTGERSEYDGGYNWSTPMPEADIAKVERVLGEPIPGRYNSHGMMTAGQLAKAIHAHTDYRTDGPVTDFNMR